MTELEPCPICKSSVTLVGKLIICERGHEFHPNNPELPEEEKIKSWNSQPCHRLKEYYGNINGWKNYADYCDFWEQVHKWVEEKERKE